MVMKEYSTFPKDPALLKPHHQIVYMQDSCCVWGVLPLCREAVGVFYSSSQMGKLKFVVILLLLIRKMESKHFNFVFLNPEEFVILKAEYSYKVIKLF